MKRTRTSCGMCDLKNHVHVPAQMPDKPVVAIYRFSPDINDVREVKPFAGGMGKVIAWAVGEAGLRLENCFLGNIISCKLDDGDVGVVQKKDCMNFCRGGLFEELSALYAAGCTTIIALGTDTAEAFGVDGKLAKNRGSVFNYTFLGKTFHIIPSYSPEELCASHWKKDGGGAGSNAVAWIADFKKAVDIAQNGWKILKENFILEPTIDDVRGFINKAIKNNSRIAVDTETTSLDKQRAKIVVCGIATSDEDALSIPFLTTHGYPYWHPVEEIEVKAMLKALLLNNEQIYQNCFYDIPILIRHGFEFDLSKVEDTLLIHHTLSPESEHNLGFITSIYGKTPYWKAEFLGRTKSILEIDQVEMRRYNLRDCVVLHQIRDAMYRDMIELGLMDFYNEEPRQLIAPLMEMSEAGIEFDSAGLKRFATSVQTARDKVEAQLRELGNLPPEFNFGSDGELRYFLFGEAPNTFTKIAEISQLQERHGTISTELRTLENELSEIDQKLGLEMPPKERTKLERKQIKTQVLIEKKFAQLTRTKSSKKYQALSRLATVRDNVKPIYVLKNYRPLTTDGGFSSVDAEGLLSYRIQLNNRLRDVKAFVTPDADEIAQIEKLLLWLSEWSQYSTYDKLVTTYTRYEPDSDGRIRPNWKAHGTATGRLSCSAPNLMNLPNSKHAESDDPFTEIIRNLFRSKPGYSLISCDFVNLEVYILAFETLDPELLKVVNEHANIHDLNTKALFGIDEADPNWKQMRGAAKIYQFGRLQYGGGDPGVFRKVMLACPKITMTLREFSEASARWMSLHPAYVEWYNAISKEVTETRKIKTAFGRLRVFLGNDEGLTREGLSTKIQSAGASIVNRSMSRIYKEKTARHLDAKFVLQIHDQLVMEVRDDQIKEATEVMVRQMETPFMFKGFERVINVDPTVGKTLGEL